MKILVPRSTDIIGMLMVLILSAFFVSSLAQAQQAGTPQQLERVEVEPPAQRTQSTRGTGQGFGYDQPVPSGQPIADYPLTPSEVISPTRGTANIATVPSAIDVVEKKGVSTLGENGIGEMVQGQPGTWASGYYGNFLTSQISIRGFSQTPNVNNRVALLLDGRNQELPLQENNTGFLFPEIIDRIELMRGDGTVQFGNKAIGGSLNVLLKKPRTNPGTYFGVEGGSWRTQREWAGVNAVKGPVAAGIFLGNYSSEGWRLFGGNGQNQEFVGRPGPWELTNVIANVNWEITPRLSFDLSYIYTKQRLANPNWIGIDQWDARDVRDVNESMASGGPEERWDTNTIGTLFYDGGCRLGKLELIGSYRSYLKQNPSYMFNSWDYFGTNVHYNKWADTGLSIKYSRQDTYDFVRNDLTVGADRWDGFYGQEQKIVNAFANNPYPNLYGFPWTNPQAFYTQFGLQHQNETHSYRESESYWIINQTRLWDRLIATLGYRNEDYSFPNLYFLQPAAGWGPLVQTYSYPDWPKSATLFGLNLVYDKQLGSNIYYKHARTYRYPTLDEMINYNPATSPAQAPNSSLPIYPLGPEEGTLQEWAIRHWFSPSIYLAATYYQLDMDNEILGAWQLDPLGYGTRVQANVPQIQHEGVELEGMIRITPRWTFSGNLTRQKVMYGSDNYLPPLPGYGINVPTGFLTGKWVPVNPNYMYNCTLVYDNKESGFSASIGYMYAGARYFQGDDLNAATRQIPEAKIGNLAISQTLFDGSTSIYFGIKNFNDCMYLFNSFWDYSALSYAPGAQYMLWPDAGRTYYTGLKTNLDFERMRLPTWSDLNRMQRRLYGAASESYNSFTGMGSWMRNMVSF